MRPFLCLGTGLVLFLAACGGKTTNVGIDGGPPTPSGSSGSGSSGSSGNSGSRGGGGSAGSSSGVVVPGLQCQSDNAVACGPGTQGYTCVPGTDPVSLDSNLACGPVMPDEQGFADYCCAPLSNATPCVPDDLVSCGGGNVIGFQCAAGQNPTESSPTLDCSTAVPDPDGVDDDYCCFAPTSGGSSSGSSSGGGGTPLGCTPDSSLACSGGAEGFACPSGDNPEAEEPNLSCSTPTASGGEDDYCCFAGFPSNSSACVPDDVLTTVCADADTYGFQCNPGDDPSSFDPQLNCSTPEPDPDGVHDDYCCTYE